jgi:uncharacterized membrane protein YkvA (DUF1232 family)
MMLSRAVAERPGLYGGAMSQTPEVKIEPPAPEVYEDAYVRLRKRVLEWAQSKTGATFAYLDVVLAAPDLLHLLYRLMLDPGVRGADKAKLAGAFAYFVTPIDLMAEAFLGPIGYLDDVALAAFVLSQIIRHNPEAVERNWAGDQNVIALIERILSRAELMLGPRLWKKLKRRAPDN